MVIGRCAFTRRLRGSADQVVWHETGEYYMLVVGKELQVSLKYQTHYMLFYKRLHELDYSTSL